MKTRPALASLAAAVLALSACGGGDSAETSSGAMTLRFIFPNDALPGIIFYPYFVAEDLGFFEDENLTVEAIPSDGSSAATQQLVAGQADLGTPFSAASLDAFVQGLDTRYVYTYSTGQNFGISALAGSGIDGVDDLEGQGDRGVRGRWWRGRRHQRRAHDRGTRPASPMSRSSRSGRATRPPWRRSRGGEVDAYASSGGDMLLLRARGLDLVDITPEEFTSFPAHGQTTTAEGLENKREEIAAFGRAYAKATLFCQTNRDACQSIMARLSPTEFEEPASRRDRDDPPAGHHGR